MTSYSEIIQIMAAMIIFSTILLNANRMIHRNTLMQIEGELEQEVIALGQEIIEEAHTKDFDEVTIGNELPPTNIPDSFTGANALGTDGEASRRYYNDYDDYNGHSEIAQTQHGDYTIDVDVFYVDEETLEYTTEKSTFK
ncbi:MAG: hypothetical protein WD059_02535, partial [Balneolaceae bacterium]